MSRIRRTAAAGTLAVGLIGLLAACSSATASPAGSNGTLEVGQLGQAKITAALLEASGEDEGMDYTLNWSLFDSGPAFVEAIPSGTVDAAMMADTPAIFAQAAGVPMKVVAAASSTADGSGQVGIVVPGDSPIRSVSDLKGKKVAITQNTILQYTLAKVLEDEGLSYTDVAATNLTPVDAATALQSGDVDAAALLDPQLSAQVAAGSRVIADGAGLVADAQYTVGTAAALADDTKSEHLEDFVLRVQRAYDWSESHQDEWAAAYAEVTGLSPEIADAVVARQQYELTPIADGVIAAQQDQSDVFTDLGILQQPQDVAAEFDDRYNDAVTEAVR